MKNKGFTIVEVLLAIFLGLVLISGLLTFFNKTSKLITLGQDQAKSTAMAQFVLNKIVKDIETANTQAPTILGITEATWKTLPPLPYYMYESYPYSNPSTNLSLPTAPAARKFISQNGLNDKYNLWYPNPSNNPEDSNSLVFYKVISGNIYRITYRKGGNNLIRESQKYPFVNFSNPSPSTEILLKDIKYIQFTYPLFEQEMVNNSDFEYYINSILDKESYLNNFYRKTIAIKLCVLGGTIGTTKEKAITIKTQVTVKN